MKKQILILSLVVLFLSCTNYTPIFDEFVNIIGSLEPLKPVESIMVDNDTPEDVMIHNTDNEGNFKSMTSVYYNWSGNLGGPSSVNLSFNKEENLILLKARNTTGSPYTGYEQWEDTYYLDFNEGIWVYDDVSEKKGRYYGIGFGENPPTLQGTTGYKGNIQVYEDLPNVLLVQVFGGGNSNWKVASYYHFKGENLFEKFQNLRQMIKEIEE